MKRLPLLLAAIVLAGCATIERQQLALDAVRDDLRTLSAELGEFEESINQVSARLRGFETGVNARLEQIDEALAQPISVPMPICPLPESPAAGEGLPACEAPLEAAPEVDADKVVVGAVEKILITPPGIAVNARIDTGAETSSISATNVVLLERDGDDWVRFDFEANGETHTLERRVRRFVRILQQSDAVGARRPVIRLWVQVGELVGTFEFNLSDRTHLEYAIILGRNLLVDLMMVDVSQEFLLPLPDREG